MSVYGCISFPFCCIHHASNHSNSNKNENVSGDPVIRRRRKKSRAKKQRHSGSNSVKKKANPNVAGEIEIIIKMYVYLLSTFLQ